MYLGVREGDWWGVFVCAAFLLLLVFFYDVLRIESLREKRPHGAFAPSRRLRILLFAVLGLFSVVGGAARLTAEVSVGGFVMLAVGLVLLWSAFGVARGRT
jgi:hypothetical protein